MARPRYYTPPIDRDLVTLLYHAAKTERIPMTRLASRLVREGLARLGNEQEAGGSVVQEDSPSADPRPA